MQHDEWRARLQASQQAHEQWMETMRGLLAQMAQQTLQINASLQTVATGITTHEVAVEELD